MSFTYGFYDSINHDRTYNARQMSEIFDGIINDGVFESIGSKFMVSAVSGMQIKVGSGRAWFNHTWTNNDSDMPLTLDAAEPLYKRIDAIVLEVNENQDTRANSIKIIKGTPASTPSKPTLINIDGVHQHPLAWITVNGGATAITQANIENAIGTSQTPYVTAILQLTNVDQLLAQWDAQFGEWFRNIQAQMEGDVATNLQRQISAIDMEQTNSGVYYEDHLPYAKLKKRNGEALNMPEGWELGDIRTTSKKDLDSTWALCNGEIIQFEKMSEPEFIDMQVCNTTFYDTHTTEYQNVAGHSDNVLYDPKIYIHAGIRFVRVRAALNGESYINGFIAVIGDNGTISLNPMNGVSINDATANDAWFYSDGDWCYYFPADVGMNTSRTTITGYRSSDLINWTSYTISFDFSNIPSYTYPLYITKFVKLANGKYVFFVSRSDSDATTKKYITAAVSTNYSGPFTFLENPYSTGTVGDNEFRIRSAGQANTLGVGIFGMSCDQNKIYLTYYEYTSSKYSYGVKVLDLESMTASVINQFTLTSVPNPGFSSLIIKENMMAVILGANLYYSNDHGNNWFSTTNNPFYSAYTPADTAFFFSSFMNQPCVVCLEARGSHRIFIATLDAPDFKVYSGRLLSAITNSRSGKFGENGYQRVGLQFNSSSRTYTIRVETYNDNAAIMLPTIAVNSARCYLKIAENTGGNL